jgi:hypothetical protein
MRDNPIDELPGLITDAGFEVTGSGDRWPLLRYVLAWHSTRGDDRVPL